MRAYSKVEKSQTICCHHIMRSFKLKMFQKPLSAALTPLGELMTTAPEGVKTDLKII